MRRDKESRRESPKKNKKKEIKLNFKKGTRSRVTEYRQAEKVVSFYFSFCSLSLSLLLSVTLTLYLSLLLLLLLFFLAAVEGVPVGACVCVLFLEELGDHYVVGITIVQGVRVDRFGFIYIDPQATILIDTHTHTTTYRDQ